MNAAIYLARAAVLLAALALPVMAGAPPAEAPDIVINEGELSLPSQAQAPAHLQGALPRIYSGWLFRDATTREMQMDDFANPGVVFADQGLDIWTSVAGRAGKSCASCHGDIDSMKGLRAVMPRINSAGVLWSIEDYINHCRSTRMGAEPLGWKSDPMKNLTAAIAMQSRGIPVNVSIDGDYAPYWEKGRKIYYTRYGQLQLSCANCHEDHYGDMIRADHLSQGQVNGFPVYRLKQAGLVSLHNRFRGCIRDTRAEPFAIGSDEFRALELYVASRGNGLPVEGVSVRQ